MKKRTLGIVAGLLSLGIGGYLGGNLVAQQSGQGGARALVTHIGFVNLRVVISKYEKFKNYEQSSKQKMEGYQKQLDEKKARLVAIKGEIEKPTATDEQRERLEKEGKQLQREAQEFTEEIKKRIMKEESEFMVQVYKEIKEVVERTAEVSGLDLVMQYNDANPEELFLPANVQRKVTTAACLPLYMHKQMDITEYVAYTLNQKLKTNAGAH